MSIPVKLGERSYAIVVSADYAGLPAALARLNLSRVAIVVTHPEIWKRSGRAVGRPLERAGWTLKPVFVPASETSKSLRTAELVIGAVAAASPMQTPLLLAFGGGVVGDLTGFVAAVYRRGVPYAQLPTTLLAQVDSAIGGKTGVDLSSGKNLVGAFYQPRLVWNQTSILASLPPRQVRSGLGEIIKYGVIADPKLFELLERRMDDCLSLKPGITRTLIDRSAAIKADVVSKDERETRDIRIRLNFGHTLGHAIESATGYRRWTHGEAIAVGMAAASEMAVKIKAWPQKSHERLVRLIQAAGLPIRAPGVPVKAVLEAMRFDKKFTRGRPRWVLPTRIGKVAVREDVPASLVEQTVRRYLSPSSPS